MQIMKYIFPRQFGLHNVFTSRVDTRQTSHAFKDYTLREQEIAFEIQKLLKTHQESRKSGIKIPKRLRGLLVSLVEKLQKLHARCAYVDLLRHYCPVKVFVKSLRIQSR